MSFEGAFQADNWHREADSLAVRNNIRTRRWGMRVTVYTGADAGDYVLEYGRNSTDKQDNLNWLKVANINTTWGGAAPTVTNALSGTHLNGTTVYLGGPLLENTTISDGGFTLNLNLASAKLLLQGNAPGTPATQFLRGDMTWAVPPTGITNTAGANELGMSNGTNIVPSGMFMSVLGQSMTFGSGAIAGATRTFTATGSASNIAFNYVTKGSGVHAFQGDLNFGLNTTSGSVRTVTAVGSGGFVGFNFKTKTSTGSFVFSNTSDAETLTVVTGSGTTGIGSSTSLSLTAQTTISIAPTGNIVIGPSITGLSLAGSVGTSGQVFTSQGAGTTPIWTTPSGAAYTSDNGITLAASNFKWGGQLDVGTATGIFASNNTSINNDINFGATSTFTQRRIGAFSVYAGVGQNFYAGDISGTYSAILNTPSVLSIQNRVAATNNTTSHIVELSQRTTGSIANDFGYRFVWGLPRTGAGVSAFVTELKVIDITAPGSFQMNIGFGQDSNNTVSIANTIQSYNDVSRTTAFFTNNTSFGGGVQVMKIGNATTPASALVADSILLWAQDTSDATSSLALFTEQAVEAIGATVSTDKLKVKINGVEYWILLAAV